MDFEIIESNSVCNWLPDVSKLLQPVLIMPVTNATSERSFTLNKKMFVNREKT